MRPSKPKRMLCCHGTKAGSRRLRPGGVSRDPTTPDQYNTVIGEISLLVRDNPANHVLHLPRVGFGRM